jgi:hypothetical protein
MSADLAILEKHTGTITTLRSLGAEPGRDPLPVM